MSRRSNVVSVGLCVLSLSAIAGTAMAEDYPKHFEQDLISVCKNAAENDRMNMHQAVQQITLGRKHTGPTYRMLGEGLRCNGMNLAAFADYYGATDTYQILKRYSIDTRIEIRDIKVSRLPPEHIKVSFVSPQ